MHFQCPHCKHQIYYLDMVITANGISCGWCAEMPINPQQQIRAAVRRNLLRREREVIDGARWVP